MRLFRRKMVVTCAGACAGALVAGLAAGCSPAPGTAYKQRAAAVTPPGAVKTHASPVKTVPAGPVLTVAGAPTKVAAKGAILADATTGQVLWSRQPGTVRPMASVTKVMTAYLVIGAGDLDRTVTVPKGVNSYAFKYGGSSADTHPGEKFTARELLYGLLLPSGADAAYTLASAYGPGISAFLAKMNAAARQLGMDHTHFTSPDGLPYPTEYSTYSTPSDLLILGKAAMKSPVFRSVVHQVQYHLPKGDGHDEHWWYNDNSLLRTYRGALGIKTGYTDKAGHCLLFEASRNGRTLIGVVLGSPPTGVDAGEDDATRILNWGFSLKQTG